MKRILNTIIVIIAALLIIIQFFPPEKNDNLVDPKDDIVFHLNMPADVKNDIVKACYDCHSNKTEYPFYNRIAPVSWLLAKHIRDGKEQLNFSEWSKYDRKKQINLLTAICDEIISGDMPLKGYVFMHREANLNEEQAENICLWTEEAAEEVMSQKD